jgi:hypothetical protein
MSSVRMRVAISDWCASRNMTSVMWTLGMVSVVFLVLFERLCGFNYDVFPVDRNYYGP